MLAQPESMNYRRIEKIVVVLLLLFLSGGIVQKRLIYIPVTLVQFSAVMFALFFLRRQLLHYVRLALRDWPLVLVIVIALCSVFWSVAPLVTLDTGLWLLLTTLFGIYIAARFTLEEQLNLILWMTVVAAVSSIIVGLAAPEIGIHPAPHHEGLWRGAFNEKNQFSRYMSLGAILTLYYGRSLGWWRWPLFALMGFLLILSGGATGILAFIVLVVAIPFYQIIRLRHMVMVGVFLISIPFLFGAGWWLSNNYDDILVSLNRDATLTGRTDLWSAGFEVVSQQPLFGHGFRASFQEGSSIMNHITWRSAPFAHNHWIDLALDLGIITVIVFAFGFFRTIWNALFYARNAPTRFGLFPFVFLTFIFITINSTQSLIAMFDILWIMYVSVTVSLSSIKFNKLAMSMENTRWQNQDYQRVYNPGS